MASWATHRMQIRHDDKPNRVRLPTDRSFTSRCSPLRIMSTQLRSITKLRPTLTRTFTSQIRYTYTRTSSTLAVESFRFFGHVWIDHLSFLLSFFTRPRSGRVKKEKGE